jgi:hypothetical protein
MASAGTALGRDPIREPADREQPRAVTGVVRERTGAAGRGCALRPVASFADAKSMFSPFDRSRLAALAAVLGTISLPWAAPASAADPVPIGSANGVCVLNDYGSGSTTFSFPPAPVSRPHTVARITMDGAGRYWYPPGAGNDEYTVFGAGFNIDPNGAGTYWQPAGSVSAGQAAYGKLSCENSPVAYKVDWFETPSTPTSYAGVQSTGGFSVPTFVAPGAGQYVADVSVSQGAVQVSPAGEIVSAPAQGQTVVTRGTLNFDVTKSGVAGVVVKGLDGPPAIWSVTVRALPVALMGPAISPNQTRQGTTMTITYSTSGDANLTALVLDAAGRSVRKLAGGLPVSKGEHSLRWDGFNDAGNGVSDGVYRVQLSLRDNSDTPATKSATVVLDSSRPGIRVISAKRLKRSRPLVVDVHDRTSGLRSATLTIGPRIVTRLVTGTRRIVYRPRGGWRRGARYRYTITAVDRVGNRRVLTRSVTIR